MLLLFSGLIILFLLALPVAFAMGISSLLGLLVTMKDVPLVVVPQRWVAAADSFALMAVPLFLLAGALMDTGGLAKRIVNFAAALVGWLRGGLYYVMIVASMIFADISGSAAADTAAVGSVLIPQMRKRGYNPDFATAMNASGGCIGPIIPPSITSVVIGYTCNISIGAMFAGSFIPGVLVGIALMVASYIHTHSKRSVYIPEQAFSSEQLGRATFEALPALFAPVVIVGGILGGIFTPTEAAAVAVFYGLLVGMFIYKELTLAQLPPMLLRVASQTAMVLFIAANASLFAWLVAVEQIPQLVIGWITAISSSPVVFLLIVNLVLVITGCLMETIAAIIILMPILYPVATHFGIHPVHFGVLVTVNLCIGMVTPPYGIALYVASTVSGRSVAQVTRHLGLPIVAMILVLVLITYIPESVLVVPRIAGFIQ